MKKIGGQNPREWKEFVALVQELQPTSYLEIGAKFGMPMRYLIDRVPSLERVGAVDWPDHGYSGRRNSLELLEKNLEGTPSQIWVGDSKDPQIIEEVSQQEWDVIFIDADHSYEGVKADYENYGHMAKMVLGFHDICHDLGHQNDGPGILWKEIGGTEVISHDGAARGIGVIRK
jgi:cephalosporin hydroxylase